MHVTSFFGDHGSSGVGIAVMRWRQFGLLSDGTTDGVSMNVLGVAVMLCFSDDTADLDGHGGCGVTVTWDDRRQLHLSR